MKYLVVGSGSIGKRHIRNLLSIKVKPEDIAVVDTREDRRQEVKDMFSIQNLYNSFESAMEAKKYDAALICTPTSLHIPTAVHLAKKGIHMIIEKPLSHNLEGVEELKEIVDKNKVVVEMAYIFRYSPLTKKVKELLDSGTIGKVLSVRGEFSEYLPDWHPWEDYRSFYMAQKSQGGGSVLDQSHIMDLIHYLIGGFKSVYAINTKISSLEVNADDIAEMIVTLKNGVIASIHTDIFGRDHKKYLEIKGEKGNILWDFYMNEVRHYNADTKSSAVFRKFPTDFNLCYIEELKHFIECCQGLKKPTATLQEGIETMELIMAVEKSHLSQKVEHVR